MPLSTTISMSLFRNCSTLFTLALTLHFIILVSSQQLSCRPGSFFDGAKCKPCQEGTYQDKRGATRCKKCPAGTYSEVQRSQGIDLCLPCPAGTFFNGNGNPSLAGCIQCPDGKSSVPGSISCVRCGRGKFLLSKGNRVQLNNRVPVCRRCPSNEISTAPNAQSCERCPLPLVNNPSRTSCINCQPGFGPVVSGDSVTCVRCTDYNVSDGTQSCQPCPRGFINTQLSEGTTCTPCPEGTTSDLSNKLCSKCGPGENLGAIGMPFCLPANTPCPENYFFNKDNVCQTCNKSERYSPSLKTCVPCGVNEESRGGLDRQCEDCDRNREGGKDGCVCKPGIAINHDGRCFRCQLGMIWNGSLCEYCKGPFQFVKPGALKCSECPSGTVPNEIRTGCESCPPGTRPSSRIKLFQEQVAVCVDVTTGCPLGSSRLLSTAGELARCSSDSCPQRTGRGVVASSDSKDPNRFVGKLRQCAECPNGTFLKRRTCQQCADNEKSGGGKVCERCPDGLLRADLHQLDPREGDGNRCGCISNGKSMGIINRSCELCPRGSFGDPKGESGCRKCPKGLVSTSKGSTECSACPSGLIANAFQSDCEPCPPGTTSFGVGETKCVRIGSLR